MKKIILGMIFFASTSSFASKEAECGFAYGLAVSAESMTAYGTSEHFFTNREHAGAVYGTKQRQINKLVESIKNLAPSLTEKGHVITEEADALKAGVYRVHVTNLELLNKGIDSADASLKSFARAMKNLCK